MHFPRKYFLIIVWVRAHALVSKCIEKVFISLSCRCYCGRTKLRVFQFLYFFFFQQTSQLHGENLNEDCGEGFLATSNSFVQFIKILFLANVNRLTVNVVIFYSIDRVFFPRRTCNISLLWSHTMCEISRLCEL